MVSESRASERWLCHEGGALTNGIRLFMKETPERSSALPPRETTPHKKSAALKWALADPVWDTSWPRTFSIQDWEKLLFFINHPGTCIWSQQRKRTDILTATAVSEASSFLLAIRMEQWSNLLHDLWVQRQEDSSGQVAVSTLGSIEPLWYVGHKILTDRVHHHKVNGVFIKNELGIKCYFGIYLHGVPK